MGDLRTQEFWYVGGLGGGGCPGTNPLRILKDNCITHLFKPQ